ncbi:DUF6602 domain-containing protein [Microbacterium sp. NPDC056736]|uniref:DUF6602 domain-containing protein n=1 Tax=Microbacterium sp. NPDC056736 TaxID=3345932 RepID=UPI00366DA584
MAESEPAQSSIPGRIIESHAREAIERMRTADVVTHKGERGRAREEVLRQYLAEIVPAGFDVATGFIIDVHGAQSRQQDLIIVRRDYHPRFQVGGAHFYPVESVAAVIEVKSSLNKTTFLEAIENAASVKRLDRTGGGQNYLVNGGSGGSRGPNVQTDYDDHQIMSMIVAARSDVSWEAAHRTFDEALRKLPRSVWPNSVAVAETFYLSYDVPDGHPRTHAQIATGVRMYLPEYETNVEPLVDVAGDLWSWLRVAPLIDVAPLRYFATSDTFRQGDPPDSPLPAQ